MIRLTDYVKTMLAKSMAVILLTAGLFGALTNCAAAGPVKHIILFIGDGMHLEHEIAASRYLTGKDEQLKFHKFDYQCFMSTWDVTTYNRYASAAGEPAYDPDTFDPLLGYDPSKGGTAPYPAVTNIDDTYFLTKLGGNYPATDSASAGTAWATGVKTDDGNIAWQPTDPPNGSLETIAQKVRNQNGWAMGVVSTVPFTHATPAAHVSHNTSRNNYHAIATEILTLVKPDVVVGGGHPDWAKNSANTDGQFISQATLSAARSAGDYIVVERQPGQNGKQAILQGAGQAIEQGKKLFGLFGGSGGNFEPPVPTNDGKGKVNLATLENPTLKDSTVAALEVLRQDPDGFFVMIEQGDIDWANHANDFPWMIGTVWDLNQAVKAAVDFVENPFDDIDWDNTLLIVTSDHGNSYMRNVQTLGKGELPGPTEIKTGYVPGASLTPEIKITYGSGSHTNELVTLYALGTEAGTLFGQYEGTWYPGTKIIDNTQLYQVMADAAGVN